MQNCKNQQIIDIALCNQIDQMRIERDKIEPGVHSVINSVGLKREKIN